MPTNSQPEPSEREQQARALDKMRQELPFYGPEEAALLAGASALRSSAGLALTSDEWDEIEDGLTCALGESQQNAENWKGRGREERYRAEVFRANKVLTKVQAYRAALLASAQDGKVKP